MRHFQSRRSFLKAAALSSALPLLGGCVKLAQTGPRRPKPNIVLIFLDDSGWADFKPFGAPAYKTPNVEQLAAEGCRFNRFYVPQALCSASRAALLSGCYPGRTKVFAALGPGQRGLDPKFAIMPEVFGANGYKTAAFGKWHIGDQDGTRPWDRGCDESCGLLYSNDMWKHHPDDPVGWGRKPLQYFENGKVTIADVKKKDQAMLTTWYTQKAVSFINRHRSEPFFLYLAHSMPHVPLFVSDKFKDKSGAGLYGDVMMELDWSVGQVQNALKNNGLDKDTIVVFTSDNGPWLSYGNHAGVTPFREGKATSFDGGLRSACIVKYPGVVPAGASSDRMFCSVDLLPTLAHLTGAALPANAIDGADVSELWTGKADVKNPHAYYPISLRDRLEGVLSGDGRWKLQLPHKYNSIDKPGTDGSSGRYAQKEIGLTLFDLEKDPRETTDVKNMHPEILSQLLAYAESHKAAFYPKQK